VGNPVYVQMMRAMTEALRDTQYRLVLSSTGNDPKAQLDLVASLNRGYADGLVLIPLRVPPELVDAVARSPLPVVVIGSLPEGTRVDNVRADSALGIALALEHLAGSGYRRIAFLNGPHDTVPGASRRRGFDAGVARYGLEAAGLAEAADFTFAAGLPAARDLVAEPSRLPDAIVCANDLLAIAAIKAVTDAGLRVPDDIAVVGMDDSDMAVLANPALTSVDLGASERARVATDLLLERLKEPELPARQIVVPPSLSLRESTR
jgi:LacI family transcriptional regulator